MTNQKSLSVNEASKIFKKSVPTIRKLISEKKIKFSKDDRKIQIPTSELIKIYGEPINTGSDKNKNSSDKSINTSGLELKNQEIKFLKYQLERERKEKEDLKKKSDKQDETILNIQKEVLNQTRTITELVRNQQTLSAQQNQLLLEKKTGKGGIFGFLFGKKEDKNGVVVEAKPKPETNPKKD